MNKYCIIILSICLFLFHLSLPAQAEKLMPVDESSLVKGFTAFKIQLLNAIKNHDKEFIYSLLTPETLLTFGRHAPDEDVFRRMYKLDNNNDSFWSIMEKIIKLGGTWDSPRDEMVFPYIFMRFPHHYDVFKYSAITGSGVNVRSSPDIHSKVIATLSYDIVKVTQDLPPGWKKIETPEGKIGYVSSDYIHSPVDHRAKFKKIGGVWKMTCFVGGD